MQMGLNAFFSIRKRLDEANPKGNQKKQSLQGTFFYFLESVSQGFLLLSLQFLQQSLKITSSNKIQLQLYLRARI